MTPEAQRIAIATACGWAHASVKPYAFPDYLNDLNAMHEAEKVLTTNQFDEYCYRLDALGGMRHCTHATAARRAEEFLKTLGLWEDTK